MILVNFLRLCTVAGLATVFYQLNVLDQKDCHIIQKSVRAIYLLYGVTTSAKG